MNDLFSFKRFLEDKLKYKKTIYVIVSPTGITSGRIPAKGYAGTTGRLDEIARSFCSIIHNSSLGIAYLLGPPSPPLQLVYDPEECATDTTERGIMNEIRKAYMNKRSCIRQWRISLEFTLHALKKYRYLIYLLSEEGEDLEAAKLSGRIVLLLGSHIDIPASIIESIGRLVDLKASIGPLSYQASQVIAYLEYAKGVC